MIPHCRATTNQLPLHTCSCQPGGRGAWEIDIPEKGTIGRGLRLSSIDTVLYDEIGWNLVRYRSSVGSNQTGLGSVG